MAGPGFAALGLGEYSIDYKSAILVQETRSAFRRRAPRNAFARDARLRSRLCEGFTRDSRNALSFSSAYTTSCDLIGRVTAVLLFKGCAPNGPCLDYRYEFVNYCSTVPATSY